MFSLVFSVFFWLFVLLSSLLFFVLAVLIRLFTYPFDRRLYLLHRFTSVWASLYTWFNPFWRVKIEGKEKIQPDQVYVMVCNHQSLVDILVLYRLFVHFKWVSKIENFRVPLVGWNMTMNQYIRLVRGSLKSSMRMMNDCKRTLEQGSSLMIFPEGTRSPTGRVRTFQEGAFDLALKNQKPILPLTLEGSSDALPKHGILIKGNHTIRVRVLAPLPYESFKDQDAEQIAQATRELIAAEMANMRRERGLD